MPFTTGMQALKGAIKQAQDRQEDGDFTPMPGFYSLKAGDKKLVRFLTDDILTQDFYQGILCQDGKVRSFMANPDDRDQLHRYMSQSPGVGWKKEYGSGELVEPFTSQQTCGIAVERDEVLVEGKLVVQDKEVTKKVGDKEFKGKFFGVFTQAISNFWEPLTNGIYERYGSICLQDIEIARTGTNKQTNYGFMPLISVPELATIEQVQQAYFYGQPWDKEDPDRFMKCPATLLEWAAYYSSDKYYARYLAPKDAQEQASQPPAGGSGLNEFRAATTSNPAPDEAQASSGAFASLRDDLAKNARTAQR